jgi:hypothetical protein
MSSANLRKVQVVEEDVDEMDEQGEGQGTEIKGKEV